MLVMMRDTCGTWMESSGLWSQTSLETVLGLSIVTSLHTVHIMIVMMRMIEIMSLSDSHSQKLPQKTQTHFSTTTTATTWPSSWCWPAVLFDITALLLDLSALLLLLLRAHLPLNRPEHHHHHYELKLVNNDDDDGKLGICR